MKKFAAFLFALTLTVTSVLLCSCGNSADKNGKISVVCTTFPLYDWAREIIGDDSGISLTLLQDKATDLHNYQPTTQDIMTVSSCDLFVYIGGESDKWIENVLKDAKNKNMITVNLIEKLGAAIVEEEHIDGMEDENHEDHADGEDSVDLDEHIWLSAKLAGMSCSLINDALLQVAPNKGETFLANVTAYKNKLAELDKQYAQAITEAGNSVLLFADRFPFRYLKNDYGLECYAAFSGCSAETEASFKTISFLAEKVDELSLKYIMVTESSDKSIAKTVIESTKNSNQEILVLNAMQSVSANDINKNGVTYISLLKENLEVLRKALS